MTKTSSSLSERFMGSTGLKTLTTVLVIGILTACAKSPTSEPVTPPTGDFQSPTVTITSSKANPEAGETVIIDAKVSDNRDTGLIASISCDAGDLRGEFLKLPQAETEQTVTCEGKATDSAGNTGTDSVAVTVKPTTKTITMARDKTSFAQGEVAVLALENFNLDATQYAGMLGDSSITLKNHFGDAFSVGIPLNQAPGEYILKFDVKDATFTFPVTVVAAEKVTDPEKVIEDYLRLHIDGIDFALSNNEFTSEEIIGLQDQREQMMIFISELGQKPVSDMEAAAQVIAANFSPQSARKTNFQDIIRRSRNECITFYEQSALDMTIGIAKFAANLGMLAFSEIDSFLGELLGNETDGANSRLYYENMHDIANASRKSYLACLKLPAYRSVIHGVRGKNLAPGVVSAPAFFKNDGDIFADGQSTQFQLIADNELYEEVSDDFFSLLNKIRRILESFDYFPQSLLESTAELTPIVSEIVAGNVNLGTVTPNDVTGDLNYSGDTGDIVFNFNGENRELLAEGVTFNYELNDGSSSYGTFEAKITSTAKAENAMVTVGFNKATQFDVNATGANLEINQQPSLGRVEIVDYNTFIYTPDTDVTGEDSFDFVAVLGSQKSAPATVFVTVLPDLPTADGYTLELKAGESLEGPILSENADSIRITRSPTKGSVSVNGTETFTYSARSDATNTDSFEFVAVNDAGNSDPAVMNVKIESLDIDCAPYVDAVFGTWSVGTPEQETPYELVLLTKPFYDEVARRNRSGTGEYRVDGKSYSMDWKIIRAGSSGHTISVEDGCLFYDTGFWHHGFNGLVRDTLSIPVTGFKKYQLGGPFGNSSDTYTGYDLSTATVASVYKKR